MKARIQKALNAQRRTKGWGQAQSEDVVQTNTVDISAGPAYLMGTTYPDGPTLQNGFVKVAQMINVETEYHPSFVSDEIRMAMSDSWSWANVERKQGLVVRQVAVVSVKKISNRKYQLVAILRVETQPQPRAVA